MKLPYFIFSVLLSVTCLPVVAFAETPLTLTQQLAQKTEKSRDKVPEATRKIMEESVAKLSADKIVESAPRKGEILADGILLTAQGVPTPLFEAVGNRPAIITFYRGGWCPYCNLQLHAYQEHLGAIKAMGAELIAITPEKPDRAMLTQSKGKLTFTVMSDEDNTYARKLNILFSLGNDLKKVYQSFGIDLAKNQGNESWELPLAATFIIDQSRKVRFAFVDIDYKKRADPEVLIRELRKILP